MSEHDDFKAWLKTWALPCNTSREDAMYAAWQARAARIAPAEPLAWVIDWPDEPELGHYFSESADTISGRSRPLYTAPDALQAEVERLRQEVERLKENSKRCAELDDVTIRQLGDRLRAAEADAEEATRLIREAWRLLPGEETISHSVWHLAASEFLNATRTARPEVDHE